MTEEKPPAKIGTQLIASDLSDTINSFANRQQQDVLAIGLVCDMPSGSLTAIAIASSDKQRPNQELQLRGAYGLQQGGVAILSKLLEGVYGDIEAGGTPKEVPD